MRKRKRRYKKWNIYIYMYKKGEKNSELKAEPSPDNMIGTVQKCGIYIYVRKCIKAETVR